MRWIFALIACCLFTAVTAQPSWVKQFEIPLAEGQFTTDNMGQLYTVQGDQLQRYSDEGTPQYNYNNKTFGNISFVDVTNPLRIVVYYQELAQVLFLDNTLSEHHGAIALTELGYDQTSVVCASQNNGVWLFDQVDFELVWLNDQAVVGKRSGNLIQQLGFELNPNFMIERHNWVYLNDPAKGILVFDIFGTYLKTIPLKGLSSFQVTETSLIFTEAGQLKVYNFKLLDVVDVPMPDVPTTQVQVSGQRVFMRGDGTVQVYGR